MVIGNPEVGAAGTNDGGGNGVNSMAHPSGIPQDKIDNIMSGIANTGDVKMNNHRKKLRQRFDIIKKLGQGTYGKVQLGINKETGQEVAIKTIKKCKIEAEADLVRIRREVQIMSSVQHPNIIHIYEVFENREKMVLVMEFAAGGELYDYLSERKVLSEEEARRIFRQVSTAVYYCHKHKICHRDLKLENILLDENGNAKIADFGLSNVFDDQRLLATFCGSPLYASPEIVEGTPYQGPEVDCWSLGVLLYTLVYGSMPFDGSNFKRLVKQISQGDYYEPKKPSRASSLIRDMLTVCPRKRATIEQICAHWWVNENDNVSCLALAEDLANQTPVRLDVLLSLTPAAVTADQLVVPSADGCGGASAGAKGSERVPRSHSVGSIRDMGAPNTEAERRILDMVAAGGEAALMPSPTRTITPAQSPVQSKRKLETTVSMENAAGGAVKKKEKPGSGVSLIIEETTVPLSEAETPMEIEEDLQQAIVEEPPTPAAVSASLSAVKGSKSGAFSVKDMEAVENLCEQLIKDNGGSKPEAAKTDPESVGIATGATTTATASIVPRQKTVGKLDSVEETPEERGDATKVIKKFVNKHKTADLVNAIGQITPSAGAAINEQPAVGVKTTTAAGAAAAAPPPFVRKCSLQDDAPLNKFSNERRKSRILETAEKFQAMGPPSSLPPSSVVNNGATTAASAAVDKPKKFVIPGVSVGSFKKEFERKASITTPSNAQQQGPTAGERRALEQVAAAAAAAQENESITPPSPSAVGGGAYNSALEASDSKTSVTSLSLDDARRSMENSIALLRQAQNESSKEVDQLCAKTESIGVSDTRGQFGGEAAERERKLKNARAIIGNAIQPVIRHRPQPPPPSLFGIGGGGGGFGQMRATSAAGFIGYGGADSGGSGSGFGIGIGIGSGNGGANFFANTAIPTPPYTPPTPPPPPNANAALAAARQNIMGRFAPGGQFNISQHKQHNPSNSLSTSSIQSSSFCSNSNSNNSPQHQNQAQLQQKLLLQQEQQQQQRQFHHHITPIAPSYAASAAIATAANATIPNSAPKPFYKAPPSTFLKSSPGGDPNANTVKTSTASITLKSATLPRRKNAKTEIQLDIKPRIAEQQQPAMRFTTEMQHPVADLRSAPPRDGPVPYSPIKTSLHARATSLEPKEHIIPIQRPLTAYTRTGSNTTTRSGSLSRQSTVDSESDTTTTNMSQSTITGSSQPIKKSPREFIIPIAVEGGGFITPREGSIEPSESSHTTSSRSTFSRLRPTRRIGSLLNDASVDEGLPFQKIRTASINRDGGDDDSRFTVHRLRSSRPVKKISQDNDSQSSGEEDDDDGFEILTAENLFSTLLQRVRALTNRLNVNNDLTTGFPNSSRLLSNMRQGQSPFWNQEPFGRSQVSYSYSETIEKKHVRLNNTGSNVGAPWRHSMSRDLGSDMESMFSRTGATLPRGNRAAKAHCQSTEAANNTCGDSLDGGVAGACSTTTSKSSMQVESIVSDEPLDLADLDLSRLRLSKKDLETLSSITPGLPKCFQEQLLAKLPPTQARKLSRTLSMQNSPEMPSVKVYKRSQSGGRGCLPEPPPNDLKENVLMPPTAVRNKASDNNAAAAAGPAERKTNSQLSRRSLSRTRYDYETAAAGKSALGAETAGATAAIKSRSNSICRFGDDKSLCSAYTSEVSDKYKYYSPYLSKSTTKDSSAESGTISSHKRFGSGGGNVSPRETQSSAATALGRPPSGCLSPPPLQIAADAGSSSLRRRSSQRRISRFLRPDFFEEPLEEDNPLQREKKIRERETQSVLREIREKSRESSRDRLSQSSYDCEDLLRRKHSLPNDELDNDAQKLRDTTRHVRNKSIEVYSAECQESGSSPQNVVKQHRRSLSRPRDRCEELEKKELADKILQELQLLSAVRSQQEKRLSVPREISVEKTPEMMPAECNQNSAVAIDVENFKEKTATIKKIKKIKPKEKSSETSTDVEGKVTTTTVIKKIKKVVKKSESIKTPTTEVPLNIPTTTTTAAAVEDKVSTMHDAEQPKKESKLKRPKSFPTKETNPNSTSKPELNSSALATKLSSNKPLTIVESNSEQTNSSLITSTNSSTGIASRESRLMRPKSYPASKLTPPKDARKVTRSGVAIPSIAETTSPVDATTKPSGVSRQSTSEDKSLSVTPTGKDSIDTSSSSESRPVTIKKIVKVTKKSKLAKPTALSPTTSTAAPAGDSNELTTGDLAQLKEKSPEKKPSKGLLYAIGQKFEKLRDSAMSKDKKATGFSSSSSTVNASTKKSSSDTSSPEKIKEKTTLLKKKKSVDSGATKTDKLSISEAEPKTPNTPNSANATNQRGSDKPAKMDKRSRIDAMIRSLRERSVPRAHHHTSESNYIKRAVSVEEMPGTFNRNAVNKVLGLFKRFEKVDGGNERRVQSTRSTSNIERQMRGSSASPIYQNTTKECLRPAGDTVTAAASKTKLTVTTPTASSVAKTAVELSREANCNCEAKPSPTNIQTNSTCPDCVQDQTATLVAKRRDETTSKAHEATLQTRELYQSNKDKRKGLMLDLVKLDNNTSTSTSRSAKAAYINGGSGIYSNLPPYPGTINNSSSNSFSQQSMDNATNNNINNNNNSSSTNNNNNNNNSSSLQTSQTSGYRTSSAHEINRNHFLTPSTENIANYSSDSRSYQDDCASTSTFLSPTDEPELYFDNWSVCSEDNYNMRATPSPTVSRLSRASQLSSPTRGESSDPNESVIDRIKRRSFYCRFNEKKPKRTSSIVGPTAVRDYYREQQAAVKVRSSNKLNAGERERDRERGNSPDITQEFFRPLKLSPVGTELKPPIYKSPLDYATTGASHTHTTPHAYGRPRKSLNDIRPMTSPSFLSKRYGSTADNDYLSLNSAVPTRFKSSSSSTSPYESNGVAGCASGYYNTYNPKRRSSYTLNGTLPSGSSGKISSNIDGYATVGRRTTRPYDHRTMSLLDPTTATAAASSSYHRRDTLTPVRDYTSSISRSNSRYRTSSTSRSSPTNI